MTPDVAQVAAEMRRASTPAVAPAPSAQPNPTGVLRLSARRLTVRYGGAVAVDRVDLDLMSHQMTAVVGRNGAGKSSLLRALLGAPDACGGVVRHPPPGAELRVAHVAQRANPRWDLPITVRQVVACARLRPGRWWRRADAADRAAIDAALDLLGLHGVADTSVATLSGGLAQRTLLARALAQEPHVMLLDEPFDGLDAPTVALLLAILRQAAATGVAVCVALHQLALARDHFDRVVALDRAVLADGGPAQVLTAQGVAALFGLPA